MKRLWGKHQSHGFGMKCTRFSGVAEVLKLRLFVLTVGSKICRPFCQQEDSGFYSFSKPVSVALAIAFSRLSTSIATVKPTLANAKSSTYEKKR